jgi:hypothetical protein
MSCFDCFVTNGSIAKWWWNTIVQTLVRALAACVTRQPCSWWCLCCEKLLCFLMIITLIIISFIMFLIVEIVMFVLCVSIMIWCVLCNFVCWLGCLGAKGCYDNCVKNASCDTATIEWDWDPPLNTPGPETPPPPPPPPPPIPFPPPPPPVNMRTAVGVQAFRYGLAATRSIPQRRLTEVAQLRKLANWSQILRLGSNVEVDIPGAPTAARNHLQRAIQRSAAACGCKEGALGLILAVGGSLAVFHYTPGLQATFTAELWITIALGIGGALLGKLVGLLLAQWHLRRSIRHFVASLQSLAIA